MNVLGKQRLPGEPQGRRWVPALLLLLSPSFGCGQNMGTAIGPAPVDAAPPQTTMHAVSTRGATGCATGNGAMFTRSSANQTWRAVPFGSDDTEVLADLRLFAVRCLSATSMVAVGGSNTAPPEPRVAVATWGDTTTLTVHQPLPQGDLFALSSIGPGRFLAVGYQAGPTITSLGLETADPLSGIWTADPLLGGWPQLRGYWARPDDQRVAVGDSGTLLHSAGATRPYVRETNPRGAVTMKAVWAPADGRFVAAGDSGVLLRRSRPNLWEPMPSDIPPSVDWRAVHGISETDIFAVGGRVVAHFDGARWREVSNISGLPLQRDLRSVWVDPASRPLKLHLAGDQLLATCTVDTAGPPRLECAPFAGSP